MSDYSKLWETCSQIRAAIDRLPPPRSGSLLAAQEDLARFKLLVDAYASIEREMAASEPHPSVVPHVRTAEQKLEALRAMVRGRMDMNLTTGGSHPDKGARRRASIRLRAYALVMMELEAP